MKLKQNDIITVDVVDNGMDGEGIARHGEYTVFVPFCLSGETVKIKINHVKKNVAFADLLEVVSPSEDRIVSPCNRFGKCGGCDMMFVKYGRQLDIKRNNIIRLLRKNTGLDFPVDEIVPCSTPYGYRNKIQLPFGYIVNEKRATLGFYRKNSHKVVAITKCFLHGEWVDTLINIFLDYVKTYNLSVYDEEKNVGHLKHLVARYMDNAISIVVVTDNRDLTHVDYLKTRLSEAFPAYSLYQSKKGERTNVIMGKTVIPLVYNPLKIDVLGIKFEINPYSFLQLNNEIRDKIYTRVIDEIGEKSTVIDAYAGVGTLGAILAKKGCRIYNIEIVKEATADSDVLAKNNGLSDRITNINGDSAKELPILINHLSGTENVDMQNIHVILDPPRKGCDISVLNALKSISVPYSLHYISCSPQTLTRDLKILLENGDFSIEYIAPYDMFPQTSHVETLCLLRRKVSN